MALARRIARGLPGSRGPAGVTTRAAPGAAPHSARAVPGYDPAGRPGQESGRRSTASRPIPRAARRRSRANGRAQRQPRPGPGCAADLGAQGGPAVLGQGELHERELVVPAEQPVIRLAQAIPDRRGEMNPRDQPQGRIQDHGEANIEAAPAVELEIPGNHVVAVHPGRGHDPELGEPCLDERRLTDSHPVATCAGV